MEADKESFDSYMRDPAANFANPGDVVAATNLDLAQKKQILQSWKVDETELLVAADENMPGSSSSRLDEVEDALTRLQVLQDGR